MQTIKQWLNHFTLNLHKYCASKSVSIFEQLCQCDVVKSDEKNLMNMFGVCLSVQPFFVTQVVYVVERHSFSAFC